MSDYLNTFTKEVIDSFDVYSCTVNRQVVIYNSGYTDEENMMAGFDPEQSPYSWEVFVRVVFTELGIDLNHIPV